MRTIRRSSSPLDELSDAFKQFATRRAVEMWGLALIGAAGALAVALATWSVNDPSLNHATQAPVRNRLGAPGAIVADLAMQLFGLGSIALLVPLAAWGWRLLRTGELGRVQLRLALWVIGSGAATAVASALPPTARWPLPTGLGGVAGDALLAAGKTLTGLSGGPGAALVGFVFAGIAILALTASCGLGFSDDMIMMPLQAGTQWDGFGHCFAEGKMYNDRPISMVTSRLTTATWYAPRPSASNSSRIVSA